MSTAVNASGGRTAAERATHNTRRLRPSHSADDPFFVAPSGFELLAPGTALRSRRADIALFGRLPQPFSAWTLLYRTVDLSGVPQVGTTTVLLPADATPDADRPLVSYQCAIDAVSARCFPSYALTRHAKAFGSLAQFELLLIGYLLDRGWAVSVPDHEGPHGHWCAAREPGYHILDGVRAALMFEPLGLHAATPVGMWGYSGGGLATSWAAELAPEYAPELDLVGVALGSPVADPAGVFDDLNGTAFAGLPTLVVAALRHAYPAVDQVLRRYVTSEGLELLDTVATLTTLPAVVRMAGRDFGRYTTRPLPEILALPELQTVFNDIRLGARTPSAPLFVVQAVHDQVIHAARVDRQINAYIAGGAHVSYRRDRLSEHLSLHILSAPATVNWLADRLAGKPLPVADTRTVWSMAFSLATVRGLARLVRTTAAALLRLPTPWAGPATAGTGQSTPAHDRGPIVADMPA